MIISIEGYFHEVLLSGKKCTYRQLKQKYQQAKTLSQESQDLPAFFSRMYSFDVLPWDDHVEVDYVIDTDTDRIYTPNY
jgi:hypothetical protein